jgi:hypothetical protein
MLALLAAGCGGDSADNGSRPAEPSAAEAAAERPLTWEAVAASGQRETADCALAWNDWIVEADYESQGIAQQATLAGVGWTRQEGICQIQLFRDSGSTTGAFFLGACAGGLCQWQFGAIVEALKKASRSNASVNPDGTLTPRSTSDSSDTSSARGGLIYEPKVLACFQSWNKWVGEHPLDTGEQVAPSALVGTFPGGDCSVAFFRDVNSAATPAIKCSGDQAARFWDCGPGGDENDSRSANAYVNPDWTLRAVETSPPAGSGTDTRPQDEPAPTSEVQECGNKQGGGSWTYGAVDGAGIFNLTARNLPCPNARFIVDHIRFRSRPPYEPYYPGWSCRREQQGFESSETRCMSGNKIIRWQSGA